MFSIPGRVGFRGILERVEASLNSQGLLASSLLLMCIHHLSCHGSGCY